MITVRLLAIVATCMLTVLCSSAQKRESLPEKKKSTDSGDKIKRDTTAGKSLDQTIGNLIGNTESLWETKDSSNKLSEGQLPNRIRQLQKLNDSLMNRIKYLEKDQAFLSQNLQEGRIQKSTRDNFLSFIKTVLGISIVVCGAILTWLIMRRRKKDKKHLYARKPPRRPSNQSFTQKLQPAEFTKTIVSGNILRQPVPSLPVLSPAELVFSNIELNSFEKSPLDCYIVGASAMGKLHITNGKPCQDNHYAQYLGGGWGVAIIADGAGSADNSHLGSEFITTNASQVLKRLIEKESWYKKNKLPEDGDWICVGSQVLKTIYNKLASFAKDNNYPLSSLASTIIIVLFSRKGLLTIHIGDGRAGYYNSNREWKSIIKPHKGEESNHTIFLTSGSWQDEPSFKMSEVAVPECRVIRDIPLAFILMTDGCESHSYDCSVMDNETMKWNDPNLPSSKFFNPLYNQLKDMHAHGVPLKEANEKWKSFLEGGMPGLKEESDDKSMFVGILN